MTRKTNEKMLNFVEELGWLLQQYSGLQWSDLTRLVNNLRSKSIPTLEGYTPVNPNIAFLVGTLPGLFLDRRLFPKNEDIACFSEKVLHIEISRIGKRSQYELMGFIISEVTKLDDRKLAKVVQELKQIIGDPEKMSDSVDYMVGWADVIKRLSGSEDM